MEREEISSKRMKSCIVSSATPSNEYWKRTEKNTPSVMREKCLAGWCRFARREKY